VGGRDHAQERRGGREGGREERVVIDLFYQISSLLPLNEALPGQIACIHALEKRRAIFLPLL
jgi:hypothetical protein